MPRIDITKEVKEIFGDIVESATIGFYGKAEDFPGYGVGDVEETIGVDGESVIIKFTNGKTVLFSTSEWGRITSDKEDIKNELETSCR
jgi:hypothetical protein